MNNYDHPPERKDTKVVGERIGAQILDNIVASLSALVIGLLLVAIGGAIETISPALSGLIMGLGILFGLIVYIGYEPALEYRWKGQTVGKRALGIQVINEDGTTIGLSEALIRNIPVIFLLIPYFGLLAYSAALIAIGITDKRQRLFDRLAGTLVVKEHN